MKKVISIVIAVTLLFCGGNYGASANTAVIGGGSVNKVVYIKSLGIYALCGADGLYTSTAASDWTKRSPYSGVIADFAYSDAADTAILVQDNKTQKGLTPILTKNLNELDYVRNATETEGGVCNSVMYFRGGLCYDSYSQCFWAVGFEYSIESGAEVFKRIGIYYSDGAVTTAQYLGSETKVMTWQKQTGDFYNQFEESFAGQGDYAFQEVHTYAFKSLKASGNGYIIAYKPVPAKAADCQKYFKVDMRRYLSVIKITKEGASFSTAGAAVPFRGGGGSVVGHFGINSDGIIIGENAAKPADAYSFYYKSAEDLFFEAPSLEDGLADISKFPSWRTVPSTMKDCEQTAAYSYTDICALSDRFVVLGTSYSNNTSLAEITYTSDDGFGTFQKASFCTDEMTQQILGTAYTGTGIAAGENDSLCVAVGAELRVSIIDTKNKAAASTDRASTKYAYITGTGTKIILKPGESKAHGLLLGGSTADEMYYEYNDTSGAKYACDLDGIDVNGIYAWDDAQSGEYTFILKAYSADFPSVMKSVAITIEIEE